MSTSRAVVSTDQRGAVRIGLVLAGGGAKGSYQVGVVTYLAEAGVRLTAVAGASIGALNAAVVSAAPNLATAAYRLEAVWAEVGRAAGQASPPIGDLVFANQVARPDFLKNLLARQVDPAELGVGLPLWVSVYRSPPPRAGLPDWGWIADMVHARTGATAEWLHVNAMPQDERHTALCASAALPVFLPPKTLNGVRYRDGGITDNTPLRALLDHTACDLFIVVHLKRGTLWDAHDYASGRVIEIRPDESLAGNSTLSQLGAMLDFTSDRAAAMRRQGYHDAERALTTIRDVVLSVGSLRQAQNAMLDSLEMLDEAASKKNNSGLQIPGTAE
jgi:NTE family protein